MPVLHATFLDPDGGTGSVLYTAFDASSGNVAFQDAAGVLVSSGSDSPFTIAVGTLVDGVQYTWTARSFDGINYSAPTTEPDFVATSSSPPAVAAAAIVNPWGCLVKALNGHWTSPYIKAEAQINCNSAPSGVTINVVQELYRSSYTGWRFVANTSQWCDNGGHTAGQPTPQCHPLWATPRMQGYVWWNCGANGFSGQSYNYLNKAWGYIHAGSTVYGGYEEKQTGPWNANGIVKCGN